MTTTPLVILDGIRWQGEPVAGERPRALLAALVDATPRAASYDALVARVWAEDPPEHPEKALQVLVSRTRARTAADVIAHTGTGYRLALAPEDVDVLRLARLTDEAVAAAAAGDHDLARLRAEAALTVPVTASIDDPVVGGAVARALGRQDDARRLLGAGAVAAGDHRRATALLEPLVAARPDDEEVLALLLRAEATVRGVPAALARYAAYAEGTRDRLGADPGEGLRRLHTELLAREAPVREGLTYDAVPMVGRDQDLAAVRTLIERSRVVSVVGPGGLGKTRIAHLVGHLADQPVVRLVQLAGVRDPDGVLPEVASVLGVRDSVTQVLQAGWLRDLRDRVARQLSGTPTLLILDNCEHLVEAVADLVAFLVATVPDVRVVCTSRAPLGIAAERVYPLPPLDLAAATRLFEQRATAARPGVRLDPDEVRALVRRLDGLPLAIELAAARVRAMSVADVHRRVGDRFALLRGSDLSAPTRHRTLEAVIDWSWQLLPGPPQEALAVLSVFADGFSLDAAEAVLGRDPLPDISHLADQSLVVVREDTTVRYRLLETVREYAALRLVELGRESDALARLDAWAVARSRDLGPRLLGAEQIETMAALRLDVGNLVAVLRSAIVRRDAAVVVPVVAAMTSFWTIGSDHSGVFGIVDPVLDLLADHDHGAATESERGELRQVLANLAIAAAMVSSVPPKRALDLLRTLGPGSTGAPGHAQTRLTLAVFDDGSRGTDRLEQLTADPDPAVARTALLWLVQLQENSGEIGEAMATARRAVTVAAPGVGPWLEAMAQAQLAGLAVQVGEADLAVRYAERALPTMEALGAAEDVVQLRAAMAMVEVGRGDLDRAAALTEELAPDEATRRSPGWAFAVAALAEVAFARGDVASGLARYDEAAAAARDRHYPEMARSIELTPWVLFSDCAALHARLLHDPGHDPTPAAHGLLDRMTVLVGADFEHLDVPILGKSLVTIGTFLLARPGREPAPVHDPDRVRTAVRMLALGRRFGHYQGIPTGSWEHAVGLAEEQAPGALAALGEEYAARRALDLLDQARSAVAHALAELLPPAGGR